MKHRFVEAGRFWRWFLNRFNLVGIVMPITPLGTTVYFLPPWDKSPEFIRHELVHVAQIARHGRIKFSVLYLYWLIRYGYRNNPFEIEAYNQENATDEESQAPQEDQGTSNIVCQGSGR